jgi:Protein of unknown function (DUF3830)
MAEGKGQGKRIRVEVDGAGADFKLLEEWAPKTTSALWESLPVEASLIHGRVSGDVCYFALKSGPVVELPEKAELGVTSIYKGYIVLAPMPARGMAELFISYGQAEYRGDTGRLYATPVAEVEGDATALFDALRRTRAEGRKSVAVRRLDG